MRRRKAGSEERRLADAGAMKSTLLPQPASAYLFYRVLRAREASVRRISFRFGASDT